MSAHTQRAVARGWRVRQLTSLARSSFLIAAFAASSISACSLDSSSRISYQFLPSCQQISFAHTTSFSKKGSDGDPNAPDANAIQDSDEKQQRRARLVHQESLPSELNKD